MLNLKSCIEESGIENFGTARFTESLKSALQNLPADSLPLQHGLTQGGYVNDENISVTILSVQDKNHAIEVKAGVFFTEIVICCGCGDDPMPVNAYAELRLVIHKPGGDTDIIAINDQDNDQGI